MPVSLVPKLRLGNPDTEAPASQWRHRKQELASRIPKLELGNEPKAPHRSGYHAPAW